MEYARISAAAVLVSAAYLASGHAVAQETASRGDGCQLVWVTAPAFGRPVPRPRKPLNFSAAEILDLEFQVLIRPDLLAGRSLELKVLTPKGHLYQTLDLPAPSEAPDAAKRRARYRTVTARLPVAGTTIVNNSLYGTWKAEAYLAGERTACARARSFVINP
jgi:hypothetical protein